MERDGMGWVGCPPLVERQAGTHRLVFDAVGLIDDQVAPGDLLEGVALHVRHLVRRHQHVPVPLALPDARPEPLLDDLRALVLVTVEAHRAQAGAPAAELIHPVGKGRLGHEHNVRPRDALEFLGVAQHRDRLEGLAETHLVGHDPVHTMLLEPDHPVQTLQLVGPHFAEFDARRLLEEVGRVRVPLLLLLGTLVLPVLNRAAALGGRRRRRLGGGGRAVVLGRRVPLSGLGLNPVLRHAKGLKHVRLLEQVLQPLLGLGSPGHVCGEGPVAPAVGVRWRGIAESFERGGGNSQSAAGAPVHVPRRAPQPPLAHLIGEVLLDLRHLGVLFVHLLLLGGLARRLLLLLLLRQLALGPCLETAKGEMVSTARRWSEWATESGSAQWRSASGEVGALGQIRKEGKGVGGCLPPTTTGAASALLTRGPSTGPSRSLRFASRAASTSASRAWSGGGHRAGRAVRTRAEVRTLPQ